MMSLWYNDFERGCIMKQTTVRIDDELYKSIKKHLIDIDKTFNEYVNDLIKKDLENKTSS